MREADVDSGRHKLVKRKLANKKGCRACSVSVMRLKRRNLADASNSLPTDEAKPCKSVIIDCTMRTTHSVFTCPNHCTVHRH